MLKSLNRFIRNKDFYLNYWNNQININNFIEILVLEDDKVVLSIPSGKLVVRGSNIMITKLLDNEILLTGDFSSIDIGDLND